MISTRRSGEIVKDADLRFGLRAEALPRLVLAAGFLPRADELWRVDFAALVRFAGVFAVVFLGLVLALVAIAPPRAELFQKIIA
jgi:hypothetical protein